MGCSSLNHWKFAALSGAVPHSVGYKHQVWMWFLFEKGLQLACQLQLLIGIPENCSQMGIQELVLDPGGYPPSTPKLWTWVFRERAVSSRKRLMSLHSLVQLHPTNKSPALLGLNFGFLSLIHPITSFRHRLGFPLAPCDLPLMQDKLCVSLEWWGHHNLNLLMTSHYQFHVDGE